MSDHVRITDVSPRDGLQNEPLVDGAPITTGRKAELVHAVLGTGVDEIEVTSFVSPKWVPQLGDAAELCDILSHDDFDSVQLSALVPNEKGMHALLSANQRAGRRLLTKASVFTAASETFSQKNTNATIAETLERFRPVIAMAHEHGLAARGYVSCVVECPFEGPIQPADVANVCERLLTLGVDEIDLGDTIGRATPETMATVLDAVREAVPAEKTVIHLHDTFGGAAGCVVVALQHGIRSFDGSAGGLGGCPYASHEGQRAPGNIALRTLVETVHTAGFETGVDLTKLEAADRLAIGMIGGGS